MGTAAAQDFERCAVIALNIPMAIEYIATAQIKIGLNFFHIGEAHFLMGKFYDAETAVRKALSTLSKVNNTQAQIDGRKKMYEIMIAIGYKVGTL